MRRASGRHGARRRGEDGLRLHPPQLRLLALGADQYRPQPRTRNQGSKTDAPSVQPKASYIRDPETGILLEAELGVGGSSGILPQLLIVSAVHIAVTGRDAGAAAAFLSELQKALSDEVTLIEKTR